MNTTDLSPTPVNSGHSACEFRLTLLDQAMLSDRLRAELLFLFRTARSDWPTFKSDPTAYLSRKAIDCWQFAVQKLRTPHVVVSGVSAFSILGVILLPVALIDNKGKSANSAATTEAVDYAATIISFPQEPDPDSGKGVGANSNRRVGFRRGAGEGSKADAKRSSGGGGGGLQDQVTQQKGKLPPPSDIPAPIPALPARRTRALPVAGIDIDPALWRADDASVYGDPRSKSAAISMDQEPAAGWGMAMAPASATDVARELGQARMETSETALKVQAMVVREVPMETGPSIRTTFGERVKCNVPACSQSLNRNTLRRPERIRSLARWSCA